MLSKKTIFGISIQTSILVSISEYFTLGTVMLVNYFIAAKYGVAELGIFSLCYAIAQIGVLGIGGALNAIIRRDISINKYKQTEYIITATIIKALLLIIYVSLVVMLKKELSNYKFLLIILLSKGFDNLSDTFHITFQTLGLYKYYYWLKNTYNILITVSIIYLIFTSRDVRFLYYLLVSISTIMLMINCYYYWFKFGKKIFITKPISYKYFLGESWALILNHLFFQLHSRMSILILYPLLGKELLGVFTAGTATTTLFSNFSNAIGVVALPQMTLDYVQNKTNFLISYLKLIKIGFIISTFITVFYLFTINLQLLFLHLSNEHYKIFIFFGFSLPFIFLIGLLGNSFVMIGKQQIGLLSSVIMFIINIPLLFFMGKYYGIFGAVISYLLSAILQMVLISNTVYFYVKRKIVEDSINT